MTNAIMPASPGASSQTDTPDPPLISQQLNGTEMRRSFSSISASIESGPLPPPSMLSEYERVMPGLGARIVESFENEALHRRNVELEDATHRRKLELEDNDRANKLVAHKIQAETHGQTYAFVLGVAGLGVAGIAAATGQAVTASSITVAVFSGIGAVAFFGLKRRKAVPPNE